MCEEQGPERKLTAFQMAAPTAGDGGSSSSRRTHDRHACTDIMTVLDLARDVCNYLITSLHNLGEGTCGCSG